MKSKTSSISAPIGGWNVRDALAAMKASEAVYMENWWPTTIDCMMRKGYVNWATGLTGTAETIFAYNGVTGTKKLFAATSTGNIYDVSAQGAVGAASVTGLTNGQFQYAAFGNTAGNYIQCVNGIDAMQQYDGSAWSVITGAITGVATTSLVNINVFKRRIWYVQKGTMDAWYLAADAIAGAATKFPLGPVFSEGGYLVAMATWTLDGGSGMDDQAAFLSSEGEIAVYKGTDPASAATFALVGVFKQGDPIGYKCHLKYLGDVFVITNQGVVPLSKSILTAQVTNKSALTDKIQPAMATAVGLSRATYGWQLTPYPAQNMLVVNVPSTGGNYQFVMNTITGAWTKFTGWRASCWEVQADSLYYGGVGVVALAWSTNGDNGASIIADCLPAFNSFGNGTQLKKMSMVRPMLYSDGSPSVLIGINFDYDQVSQPTGVLNFGIPGSGMFWGSMVWGSMVWGGSLVPNKNWQFAGGIGYSVSMRMRITNNISEVRWAAEDYLYSLGGVL